MSAVGTLLATMVVQTRTRDILLPILLFPLTLPVVIAAVKASQGFIQSLPLGRFFILGQYPGSLRYDIFAVAIMVFDYILEE